MLKNSFALAIFKNLCYCVDTMSLLCIWRAHRREGDGGFIL